MEGGSWNSKSLIQYTCTPSKSIDLNPSVTIPTAISKTEIHLSRSKLPVWTALQSSIGELEAYNMIIKFKLFYRQLSPVNEKAPAT